VLFSSDRKLKKNEEMKKKIFVKLIIISCFFTFCKAQEIQKDSIKFDLAKFRNMELDKQYSSSIFFKNKDKRIQIQYSDYSIAIIETNINNRYGITKTFSSKDNSIKTECNTYDKINIGILKRYDDNGKITEIDLDKDHPFTIEDLTKKLKKEFNIDLNDSKIGINRIYKDQGNPFCYGLYIYNKTMNSVRQLTFSAINGELIEDKMTNLEK
jgi:uncharacterized protein YqfB (UPF0267 family)